MHRKTENSEIFNLFREAVKNGDYHIHLPSSNGYLLDLVTGALQRFETENGILSIGETAVILITDEVLHANIKKRIQKNIKYCKRIFVP